MSHSFFFTPKKKKKKKKAIVLAKISLTINSTVGLTGDRPKYPMAPLSPFDACEGETKGGKQVRSGL